MLIFKALAITVVAGYLGFVFTRPPMERNSTAQETGEISMLMQSTCTRAFKVNGEQLDRECRGLIDQLQARGYEVIKYEDGTFEMELMQ